MCESGATRSSAAVGRPLPGRPRRPARTGRAPPSRETISRGIVPHGAQHLELLVAHGVGVEGHRRLHRHEREELDEVRRDHVAQRSGLLVVRAAMLDAERLRGGDLDEVDVAPVPHGLEDAVGEAQHQQVLHGLLGEVVVDAVDLPLVEDLGDHAVQVPRRLEVAAEGLLDDDARPAGRLALGVVRVAGAGAREAGRTELPDDHVELAGRRGEVEHAVAAAAAPRRARRGRRRGAGSPPASSNCPWT